MALRLRDPSRFPPGGFDYRQTEGINYYFAPQGGLRQTATRLLDFRVANKLPRANWDECARDIEDYVIARLGGIASPFVEDSDAPPISRKKATGGGCCGAKVP